jgi:phage-related protein
MEFRPNGKGLPMPETAVVFYAEDDGSSPLLTWLDRQQSKVQDKCLVKIERLAELGYELRHPEADILRDGVYELRVRHRRVHYRMLYFFHEGMAVISHGLTKEDVVPDTEIALAIARKGQFAQNPQKHTYTE